MSSSLVIKFTEASSVLFIIKQILVIKFTIASSVLFIIKEIQCWSFGSNIIHLLIVEMNFCFRFNEVHWVPVVIIKIIKNFGDEIFTCVGGGWDLTFFNKMYIGNNKLKTTVYIYSHSIISV